MMSAQKTNTWIVIPAFNEEAVITAVVADVCRDFPRIVVVDDCSRDRTASLAERAGAVVLRHPINLGQGAALQTGIDYAMGQGAQFVVTFDADGQHDATDISRLVDALQTQRSDFALGSRFLGQAIDLPANRRLVLQVALLFTRLTTGLKLTDVHNGLRAMTRRGASTLQLRQNRMAHASELLDQIANSRLRYVEIPVTVRYTEYSLAKGQKLSQAVYILIDLIAGRLHR
jgi:glycosyltransferase involved in cell wall biosynthesis